MEAVLSPPADRGQVGRVAQGGVPVRRTAGLAPLGRAMGICCSGLVGAGVRPPERPAQAATLTAPRVAGLAAAVMLGSRLQDQPGGRRSWAKRGRVRTAHHTLTQVIWEAWGAVAVPAAKLLGRTAGTAPLPVAVLAGQVTAVMG